MTIQTDPPLIGRETLKNVRRAICGAVIDNNHFSNHALRQWRCEYLRQTPFDDGTFVVHRY
jgi:hypothetical protein